MLPFFDMPMDWKRFILILAGGVSLGFAWNAFSGRGIVLGQSVLLQAGEPRARRLLARDQAPPEAVAEADRPHGEEHVERKGDQPLGQSVLVQGGDELVAAPAAKTLLDQGALFLDARPRDFWRMSRIPGSLPLPEEGFDKAFPEVEERLRRARTIVVYCSGYGCEASHLVARKLRERGVAAAILDEGLPAWEDAGLPLDKEPRQ